MRLIIYGVLALAILAVLTGIGRSIHTAGYNKARLECEQAAKAQRDKEQQQAHTAGSILEAEDGKARTVYRTITRQVDRYIDRPVYSVDCFDNAGLRDARAALTGKVSATPEPDKPVSGPDPAGGRKGGDDTEKDNRGQ